MLSARRIGVWLTALLFIGGLFAPSILATTRANCPMEQAAQKTHCAVTPKPAARTPACCRTHAAQIARAQTLSGGCCCHLTAAPERADAPAILLSMSEPVALPSALLPLPLPPTVAANPVTSCAGEETAPRALPLRGTPTRAPPFS